MASQDTTIQGSEPEAPIDPRLGMLLAERYKVIARAGDGGMGVVYRGEHVALHRRVAIKVLHPELNAMPEVVERFEREARAAAVLEHPNVVAVTDFGRTPDGMLFLVMEYIDGESLREALDVRGPLALAEALDLVQQIGAALDAAHGAGIVHRDLKPENVMIVRREGEPDIVKVVDFGIAKVPPSHRRPDDAARTQAGMVYGTPDYMPPEQALGGEVGAPADQYALGIVLFEALTGRRPFEAGDVVSTLALQLNAPVPSASALRPAVFPVVIDAVLARMMSKRPGDRYPSVSDAVEALQLAATPPSAAEAMRARALGAAEVLRQGAMRAAETVRANPRAAAPYGVGALVLVLLVAVFAWGRRGDAPQGAPGVDGGVTVVASQSDGGGPRDGGAPPREAARVRLRAYLALPATQEGLRLAQGSEYEMVHRAFERVWDEHHDGVVAYVLGRIAAPRRRFDRVVYWFDAALRAEPTLADEPDLTAAVLRAYAEGRPEPGSEALLAGPLERQSLAPLTALAMAPRPSEARRRAERLLGSAAFRAQAEPEVIALIDLRNGEDCDARRAAVVTLGRVGGARAVEALQGLRVTRCDAARPQCNACLEPVLAQALAAARARAQRPGG
jgi:tRNA A-37 threonylcarbamoyl transferase component Bud32